MLHYDDEPPPMLTYDEDPEVCGQSMRVSTGKEGRWVFTVFTERAGTSAPSFDRAFVHSHPDGLQAGIIDGAINVLDERAELKTLAALDVVSASIATFGLAEGLDRAAAAIHDPRLAFRHRGVTLAFAGLQVSPDTILAARNGDCEVWVKSGGAWTEALPGDMLEPAARSEYTRQAAGQDTRGAWAVQEAVLDDIGAWRYPALGHHPEARSVTVAIPAAGVEEAVIGSDGVGLTAEVLADLSSWMTLGRHVRATQNRHPYPHGDVSLVWLRRHA